MSDPVTEFFIPEIPILTFKFSEDKSITVDPVEVDSFAEQWYSENGDKPDEYELLNYCYRRFKEVGKGKRDFITLGQFRMILGRCWVVLIEVKKNVEASSDSSTPSPEQSVASDSAVENSTSSIS